MGRTSPALIFGLAPGGVCRASLSPGCWWALTLRDRGPPTVSPLPQRVARGGGGGKKNPPRFFFPPPPPFATLCGGILSVALSLSFAPSQGRRSDGGRYP